jgi:hypothetical protein
MTASLLEAWLSSDRPLLTDATVDQACPYLIAASLLL